MGKPTNATFRPQCTKIVAHIIECTVVMEIGGIMLLLLTKYAHENPALNINFKAWPQLIAVWCISVTIHIPIYMHI